MMETEFASPPDRRQIILMISQACNLNCVYCYQTHKSAGLMTVETGKRILEEEFANIQAGGCTRRLEIAYMGGEPLLNFPLIRQLSEWLWVNEPPVAYELTIRTNGTLLTPEMEHWFSANCSRINVGLSMDGLTSMHRLNRTELPVNWRFFCELWPTSRVKVVLFRDSIQYLSETARELEAQGIGFEAVIGEGFEWSQESARLLERELLKLVPDYVNRPEEAVACGLFSSRVVDFFPEYPIKQVPFCGRSNNIIAYDVDGSPCICHLFSTPALGREKARWAWENLREIGVVPFDPHCTVCPIHKTCRNCFGENLRLCNSISRFASRSTICNAMRAKARACSVLFLTRFEARIKRGESASMFDQQCAERALRLLEAMPRYATL